MTGDADRRSVLAGLGAIGLGACSPAERKAAPFAAEPEAFDLSDLEQANGGRLGFVAHDLQSGRRLVARGDERFVYCSTFKMYLAAATLLRVQRGEERLDRTIAITPEDMTHHAPVTERAVGKTLTVERLMQAVVEVSDNPAANLLLKANGGIEAMRAFYRGIGDQSTTVDRYEPEMNRLDGDKDTITPLQSVTNMGHMFADNGTPLNDESQTKLLGWMFDSPTGAGRIKAGVPAGWRVAHKTGTGGYGPTNDIGVLYAPGGGMVILAAYYHANRASSAEQNESVIAEATRRALAELGWA